MSAINRSGRRERSIPGRRFVPGLRGLVGGGVLLASAIGPALATVSCTRPAAVFSTRSALDAAGEGPVDETRILSVETLHLAPGEAPAVALERAGLAPGRVFRALKALGTLTDVRAMRPGDDLRVFRTREGVLDRLEYQRRPDRYYVAVAEGEGYRSLRVDLPVRHLIRHLTGAVTGNLYDSLLRAGGRPGLAEAMSDLFAWSFDFFTDTRNGDRFDLLAEEDLIEGRHTGYGRILAARYRPVRAERPLEVVHYEFTSGGKTVAGYYDLQGDSIKRMFLKSPLNYRRISSYFSRKRMHPILKKVRPHLGVDYAAARGTPVSALGRGKVVFAGWIRGFGKTVKIKHNRSYLTQYGHLSRFGKGIRSGVRVEQGRIIGYVGSTGMATGPHLDFRVQENGRWINPLHLKGGRAEPLPEGQRASFEVLAKGLTALMESMAPGAALAWHGRGEPVSPARLAAVQLDSKIGS